MNIRSPRPAPPLAGTPARDARGAQSSASRGATPDERILRRLHGSGLAFLQSLAEHLAAQRCATAERAFVTLSYCQSLDGSIAVSRSTPCSLSCRRSLEMTHMVRSLHDGLLVGVNTILSDDPQLTVRYCEGDDPQPVVLDSRLRFPGRARLLRQGARRPIVITTPEAPADRARLLEDHGARVFTVSENEGRVDLGAALRLLRRLDIHTVMVEGGATVISSMLASELVDYCVLTITPRIIGGVKAVESLCQPQNAPPLSVDDCRYHTLDRDLIAYGRLSRG
jgi:3,4-dihydroxy 2-butanone 4-phosphate synthase/GTP cyclohydrolase II